MHQSLLVFYWRELEVNKSTFVSLHRIPPRGGFFVYKDKTNESLLDEYRRTKDNSCFLELHQRFLRYARKEAKAFREECFANGKRPIEFEELVSIGLVTFLKIVKGNICPESLFLFWQTSTRRSMEKELKELDFFNNCFISDIALGDGLEVTDCISSGENISEVVSASFLFEKASEAVFNKKNNFTTEQKKMFVDYFCNGCSYTEIATLYGMGYATARMRVLRMINKIKKILYK